MQPMMCASLSGAGSDPVTAYVFRLPADIWRTYGVAGRAFAGWCPLPNSLLRSCSLSLSFLVARGESRPEGYQQGTIATITRIPVPPSRPSSMWSHVRSGEVRPALCVRTEGVGRSVYVQRRIPAECPRWCMGYVQSYAHGKLHRASEISAPFLGNARRTLCHSDLSKASVQSFSLAIVYPRPNQDAEVQ